MEGCVEAILAGVGDVPVIGSPGTIVVYGPNAEPILSNAQREVIVAAAEYGEGRVVILAHDGYATKDKYVDDATEGNTLYSNIKKWLTRGTFSPDTTKVLLTRELPQEGDIAVEDSLVIWRDGNASDEQLERYERYVKSGGALIVGLTPWGYLQIHPHRTLDTIPANVFVKKLGVCFTPCYCSSRGKLTVSSDNHASSSHLARALTDVGDAEAFSRNSATIQKNLTWLPDEEFCRMHEGVQCTIDNLSGDIHCCPVPGKPAESSAEKAMVTLINRTFSSTSDSPNPCCSAKKIPSVHTFPGDLNHDDDHCMECTEVHIKVPAHGMKCYHPTGYYVPAGQQLVVKVNMEQAEEDRPLGWKVAVGTHTDELFNTDAPWSRWPSVQVNKELNEDTQVKTYSGGLVYFISDMNTKANLRVTLENVVQAPYFDISDPESTKKWLGGRKDSPGLWADLVGHHFMISVPASSVRDLVEPAAVVNFWDTLAETHFALAGVNLKSRRREWVVADQQPCAGYMHAGYPIVTCLDVANPQHDGPHDVSLLNVPGLYAKGSWGMFHELGHNLQDGAWTFAGTGEVTCNIFTLHAMDVLCEKKPWTHPWLKNQFPAAERYLKKGAPFVEWQRNPGVALVIYAQLARDFGWDAYKEVFAVYHKLKGAEKPNNFSDKVDMWITTFSGVTGMNLCPIFEFWGFPTSDKTKELLKELPAYMPSDEITEAVPDRSQQFREACA